MKPKENSSAKNHSCRKKSRFFFLKFDGLPFQFCENCPDFPVVVVGTKTDITPGRQITTQTGEKASGEFGCAHFFEITTKESIEEVMKYFH